jgi:hypothetical protein
MAETNHVAGAWYVGRREGRHEGPLAFAALAERAGSGVLQPNDLVWREGEGSWAPARTVAGLFEAKPQAAGRGSGLTLQGLLGQFGGASAYRKVGRACGAAAGLVLLGSVLLAFFGYSWFTGAVLLAFFWFAGEGLATVLERLDLVREHLHRPERSRPATATDSPAAGLP